MAKTKESHQYFNKVYFVDNSEVLNDKQMNTLLMVSTKNWNYYLCDLGRKIKKNVIFKELLHIELVEFNSQKKMWSFLKKLDEKLLEHDKPCVLRFV